MEVQTTAPWVPEKNQRKRRKNSIAKDILNDREPTDLVQENIFQDFKYERHDVLTQLDQVQKVLATVAAAAAERRAIEEADQKPMVHEPEDEDPWSFFDWVGDTLFGPESSEPIRKAIKPMKRRPRSSSR